MESNWRFNVWLYGESYGRFDMIARLQGEESNYVIAREPINASTCILRIVLAPEPDYYPLWTVVGSFPAKGFPYGLDVEPD